MATAGVACAGSSAQRARERQCARVEAVRQHPDSSASSDFDLLSPDRERRLSPTGASGRHAGFRHLKPAAREDWWTDGSLDCSGRLRERAPGRGAARWGRQRKVLGKIAERHPGSIQHRSHSGAAGQTRVKGRRALRRPGACWRCQASEVGVNCRRAEHLTHPYPYKNIHGHLQRIVEASGRSLFWGTESPACHARTGMRDDVTRRCRG